jgi:hypothetical protein
MDPTTFDEDLAGVVDHPGPPFDDLTMTELLLTASKSPSTLDRPTLARRDTATLVAAPLRPATVRPGRGHRRPPMVTGEHTETPGQSLHSLEHTPAPRAQRPPAHAGCVRGQPRNASGN